MNLSVILPLEFVEQQSNATETLEMEPLTPAQPQLLTVTLMEVAEIAELALVPTMVLLSETPPDKPSVEATEFAEAVPPMLIALLPSVLPPTTIVTSTEPAVIVFPPDVPTMEDKTAQLPTAVPLLPLVPNYV